MDYSAEFIRFLTSYGKLELMHLPKDYLAKVGEYTAKGATVETALMMLAIKIKGIL